MSGYEYRLKLFKVPLPSYLGSDTNDKSALLKKVALGSLKVCESALEIIKGKINLIPVLEYPVKEIDLDRYTIAEVSLGIEHPVIVKLEKRTYQIDNKQECYRQLAIKAARVRLIIEQFVGESYPRTFYLFISLLQIFKINYATVDALI